MKRCGEEGAAAETPRPVAAVECIVLVLSVAVRLLDGVSSQPEHEDDDENEKELEKTRATCE
jgi:hypothetical protein